MALGFWGLLWLSFMKSLDYFTLLLWKTSLESDRDCIECLDRLNDMDILIILIILFHKHEIVFSYVLFSISLINIHNSECIDFFTSLIKFIQKYFILFDSLCDYFLNFF